MENIKAAGYSDKIIRDIAAALEVGQKDAEDIFRYLLSNRELLAENETLEDLQVKNDSEKSLIIGNGLYYINIKLATLTVIAFILDVVITKGVLSKILDLSDVDSKAVIKISSENGHRCILKEMLRVNHGGVDENVLAKNNGECIHNDVVCKFRKDGGCGASSEVVGKILLELKEMNVCRRLEGGGYGVR